MVTAITTGAQEFPRYPAVGSTFVPLDSWVYPVFDRLAGQGYVQSAIFGLKPWARTECARLTEEARDALEARIGGDKHVEELAAEMLDALEKEFAPELRALGGDRNRSMALESLYTRVLSISGPPLTDGFHFGQTIDYDFGRPFRRGTNVIAGGAARATYGPLAVYARVEYQQSPSAPALSDVVRSFIANTDAKPIEASQSFPAIHQGRMVEGYASINFRNWQVSFGKQSLWWGMGGMQFTNNADPPWMVRINRIVPHKLPGFLKFLGAVRSEFFWARMDGSTFVVHPNLYGTRASARIHPRFELGFGHTVFIGGRGGSPLTTRNFVHSFFGTTTKPSNPGDARTSMDLSWSLPKINAVLYGEFFQDDEPAPFYNPERAAIATGLYLPRIPGFSKLDLRIESSSTESVGSTPNNGHLNYWNSLYRDGYVNRGVLLGNSVGREGRQIRVSSTYAFSPRETLRFIFQDSMVRGEFVPGGGAWRDFAMEYSRTMPRGMYLRSSLQVERISRFPILFNGLKNNVAVLLEIGYWGEKATK